RIQPDFADLNHDGKPDLVVHYQASEITGNSTIQVLFNLATGNQPWRFDTSAAVTLSTINNINKFDSPLFYDVDADGLRDLLLGKNFGRIQYYRNTGTASNPAFTLSSQQFGLIDYSEQFGYSLSPAIADFDRDGIDDLITTDSRGFIAFYPNVRDGINNSLNPDTNFYRNTLSENTRQVFLGKNLHPAVIDYNADGNPDLLFGTTEGGLLALTNTRTLLPLGSKSELEKTKLKVYPNPATDQLQVIAAPLSTFTIYSMQGKVVQTGITDSEGKASISVKGLYSGTYLLQSEGRTHKFVRQ
ncbi:MAG: T9SS type A sorting domain-containing protein, partial [Flexibacteraceae bacterium]